MGSFLAQLLSNPWAGKDVSVLQMSFRNRYHAAMRSACPASLLATKQTREVQGEGNVFAVLGKLAPTGV